MSGGPLIAADEYWSNGWRGPTVFRVSGGQLTPVPELVEGPGLHIPGTVFAHLTDHHVHLGLIDPRALLCGGITDATDLGWIPERAGAWRAANDPALPALRIVGGLLTCPGGYPARSGWAPPGAAIELASPSDAAAAVAAQAALGASAIKVALNSRAGPVADSDLLTAIVTAATGLGLPVVAHAEGEGQVQRALNAGVATLAHTPFSERLEESVLRRMASAGMSWISTLDIHGWGTPASAFALASDNLRRFVAVGGRVVYGTDLGNGPLPLGVNGRELAALAAAGLEGDALVRTIAGSDAASEAPGSFGPRFAWIPGLPPGAADTPRWLATARGCTIDTLKDTLG